MSWALPQRCNSSFQCHILFPKIYSFRESKFAVNKYYIGLNAIMDAKTNRASWTIELVRSRCMERVNCICFSWENPMPAEHQWFSLTIHLFTKALVKNNESVFSCQNTILNKQINFSDSMKTCLQRAQLEPSMTHPFDTLFGKILVASAHRLDISPVEFDDWSPRNNRLHSLAAQQLFSLLCPPSDRSWKSE